MAAVLYVAVNLTKQVTSMDILHVYIYTHNLFQKQGAGYIKKCLDELESFDSSAIPSCILDWFPVLANAVNPRQRFKMKDQWLYDQDGRQSQRVAQ